MKTTKLLVICVVSLCLGATLSVRAEEVTSEAEGRPSWSDIHPSLNSRSDSEHFLTVTTSQGGSTIGGLNTLALQPDETYCVEASYRNDGETEAIVSYVYAQGVKVQCALPELVNGDDALTVTFSADNTIPATVSCKLKLHSDEELYLDYEPGSAILKNQGPTNGEKIDAQAMFGAGALIGSNSMCGIVLPGDEYAGTVQFSFKTRRRNEIPSDIGGANIASAQFIAGSERADSDISSGDPTPEAISPSPEAASDVEDGASSSIVEHNAKEKIFYAINFLVIVLALIGAAISLKFYKYWRKDYTHHD